MHILNSVVPPFKDHLKLAWEASGTPQQHLRVGDFGVWGRGGASYGAFPRYEGYRTLGCEIEQNSLVIKRQSSRVIFWQSHINPPRLSRELAHDVQEGDEADEAEAHRKHHKLSGYETRAHVSKSARAIFRRRARCTHRADLQSGRIGHRVGVLLLRRGLGLS